jgi:sugar lactone lactonase YvrE
MAYDTSTGNYYAGYGTRLYKITPAGVVTTLAGNATSASVDGTGTNASFGLVRDMVCDSVGNIYMTDQTGTYSVIRKVTSAGVVTTIAGNFGLPASAIDGTGTNARFHGYVYGVTIDPTETYLYASDWAPGNILRRIDLSTNVVTTITFTPSWYGGGFYPRWDATTGTIIGVNYGGNGTGVMYRITTSGALTALPTIPTSAISTACIDSVGNIFATDGNKLWKYTASTGTSAIIAGSDTSGSADGLGTAATFSFYGSGGLVADPSGNIYVGDSSRVRKLTSLSGEGGILPFENSLYMSNFTTALTVQAPLSYRYVTSNVSGTTVDLTASSNRVGTTYRLTAGPSNTLTFPALSASTSGSWWTFSNAYSAAQTLTLAGTTTGLTSPISLSSNTSLTVYSDGSSYRIVTGGAGVAITGSSNSGALITAAGTSSGLNGNATMTIVDTTLTVGGTTITSNVSGLALGTMALLPKIYGIPLNGVIYNQAVCSSNGQYIAVIGDDAIRVSSNYGVTWTATTQGVGGSYPQLAMSANGAVIAATANTLVVSTNYGATWSNTPAFNGGNNTVCVSSNGSVIYASGGGATDIYVSSNSGATWTQTASIGAVTTNRAVSLSCSSNGSVVLLLTQSANMVVSSNYGASWTTTSLGGTNNPYATVSPDGATIYAANGSFPSVSSNNGVTFSNLSNAGSRAWSGPPMVNSNASVVIVPQGSNLWIATGSPVNTSSTWTSVTTPATFSSLMSSSYDGNFIVARQDRGFIWTSTDRGTTWTQRKGVAAVANLSYPMYGGISACSFDGTVAAMGIGGYSILSVTSNAGQTWTPIANSSNVYITGGGQGGSIAISSNGARMVIGDSPSTPYISSNTGVTWTPISALGANGTGPVAISADGNVVLIRRSGNAGINLSTNGGSSWSTVGPAVNYTSFAASSNGAILLAGGVSAVYISSNSGSTWTTISALASANWKVAMSYNGVRMVAARQDGYIWWSSNSGVTWTEATSSGSQPWEWISMSADGSKCAAAPGTGNNGAVSTSLDGGVTWAITGSSYGRSYGTCISGDGSVIYGAPYFGGTSIYAMPIRMTLANPTSSVATITNLTSSNVTAAGSGSNFTVTGNELVLYPGSTSASNYGAGHDTLTLKTTSEAYGGGVASLAFANSNTGYPLGRVYAVDNGTVPTGPSTSLVFQSTVSNQLVPAMTITGPNVTLSGTIGGVMLSDGEINNVPATPSTNYLSTIVGTWNNSSHVDGVGTNGGLAHNANFTPYDPTTGLFYFTEWNRHFVRTYNPVTNAVATIAGAYNGTSTDGTGSGAYILSTMGTPAVAPGGIVYFQDGYAIRRCTPAGVVTTIAGVTGTSGFINGTGTNARFNGSTGVYLDPSGSNLYVTDTSNNVIRILNLSTNVVTTWATTPSTINGPRGGGFDASGNFYVATGGNSTIQKISPAGVITFVAGGASIYTIDGVGTNASICGPNSITVDKINNVIYIVEAWVSAAGIRRLDINTATITSITGPIGYTPLDGVGTSARWNSPVTCSLGPTSSYLIAGDAYAIRKMTFIKGSGGVLPYNGSLYTSNSSTALTVQAPLSYRYATSNVSGTTVDLTASSNVVGTTYRLTAGPSNTLTFPALSSATSGSWWSFSNAFGSTQTLTLAGTTTGLSSPVSLLPSTTVTIYSDGANYRTGSGPVTLGNLAVSGGNISNATSLSTIPVVSTATVTTFAGSIGGSGGNSNATGTNALFNFPTGSCVDPSGNVYIADNTNNILRRITPAGVVTTFAGSGGATVTDGTGTSAAFKYIYSVAYDPTNGTLVVGEVGAVRRVTLAGVVTTIAGGPNTGSTNATGTNASFNQIFGIVVDPTTGNIYCAEQQHVIRQVTPAGVVTLLAGSFGSYTFSDGVGTNARFYSPWHITTDGIGNLYVADYYNYRVRKIVIATATVTTVAGNNNSSDVAGTGTNASFSWCIGMAYDSVSGLLYTSTLGGKVISVSPTTGVTSFFVGSSRSVTTDGIGTGASLGFASSICLIPGSTMYFTDRDRNNVRKVTLQPYFGGLSVSNNALNGVTLLNGQVGGVTLSNGQVGGVTLSGGAINNVPATPTLWNVTTFIGNTTNSSTDGTGTNATVGTQSFQPMAYSQTDSNVYFADVDVLLRRFNPATGVTTTLAGNASDSSVVDGTGTTIRLKTIRCFAFDLSNNLYIGDFNRIRRYVPSTNTITTLVGNASQVSADGTGTNAVINTPTAMVFDPTGTTIYFVDFNYGNNVGTLKRYVVSTGVVTTITMTGTKTDLGFCCNLSWDTATGTLVGVSPFANNNPYPAMFRVTTSGVCTLPINLGALSYVFPMYSVLDAAGNLYFADPYGSVVGRVAAGASTATVIAGTQVAFGNTPPTSIDGLGGSAVLRYPGGIALDSTNTVYVYDVNRIRKLSAVSGSGGILPFENSLYTSNSSTALTVRAPLTCAGTISVQQIQETLNTIASPGSGTVVANWSTGNIWYVSSMSANFTINLTNLPTVANKSYSVVFTLVQGATPYYISALQIAGVAQTIKWSGGSAPTATANRVELETFTLMYTGSAWTVLGQLTTFG